MSRSVATHYNAAETVYLQLPDDFDPDFGWEDLLLDLRQVLDGSAGAPGGKGFPSLRECDRWQGRENHIILENSRAEISVSEYNGIVAVCLAPLDVDSGLDTGWCDRVSKHFRSLLHGAFKDTALLSRGCFSNGEQCFARLGKTFDEACVTSKEGTLW